MSKIITPSRVDTSKQILNVCYLEWSLMKATGLSTVVPRCIFVPLNQYGCPKIESKVFRARHVKRPATRLGNAF